MFRGFDRVDIDRSGCTKKRDKFELSYFIILEAYQRNMIEGSAK